MRWAASIALAVVVSACSQPQGAALMQRALSSIESGDYRAATIDLKNLLRAEPGNAQARRTLGELMIRGGDAAGGVRELRRARELGDKSPGLEAWLARGLMALRELDDVITDTHPESVADTASRRELLQIRGDAFLGLERFAQAKSEFEAALGLEPRDVRSLLGLAAVSMETDGFDAAKSRVDEALAIAPEDPLAWRMLGGFLLRDRRFVEARDAYKKAGRLAEGDAETSVRVAALTGLAESHMALGELDAAEETTKRLAQIAPASAAAVYLQARSAFLRGDHATARRGLEQILAQDSRNNAARLLLGAVSYVEGNLGQADMYLASVIASDPGNNFARKLLADTRFRQDRPKEAMDALEPALKSGDTGALSLAGRARIAAGDLDAGLSYLEQGAALKQEDARLSLQLAAGYLAAGRMDRAIEVLEKLEAGGDDAYRRDLMLLVAQIRSGNRKAGLEQARRFASAHPTDGLAQSLVAGLALDSGDRKEARVFFEKAVQLAPDNAAAVLNLAKLELIEGRLDVAERGFKSALALQPTHPAVLVSMAQLSIAKGDRAGAIRWLETARSKNPRAIEPRVLLGQYYLAQRDFAAAQRVALEVNQVAPEDPAALNVLGLSLAATGRAAEGVTALENLSGRNPQSASYKLSLARAYLAAGRVEDAMVSIRESVELDERYLPALGLLASMQLAQGDRKEAEQTFARMKRVDAHSPVTRLMEGDLAMSSKRYDAAADAYQAAGQKTPNRSLVMREFIARRSGRLEDPTRPLEEWLATNPGDSSVRMALAQAHQEGNQLAEARRQYEAVLAIDPKHAAALNNLAWLQLSAGDARAALKTATQAYDARSDLADIVDTYGWALLKNGERVRAVEVLRKAHGLAPRSAEIRYHLAAALADHGDVKEAREHLRDIAAMNEGFPSRGEATELLKRLDNEG